MFLATPGTGLRDSYVKVGVNLPAAVTFTGFYHRFDAQRGGARFGGEFDALLTRKFGKYFTGAVKFADFRRDSAAFPDMRKLWLQVEASY